MVELAWVREDAIACSEALGAAGQSVLGGEVWLVDEHGRIQGVLPAKDGGRPGVHHWEVPPWEPSSESWVQFCRRAAACTVSVLRQMDVEGELASEWWPAALQPDLDFSRPVRGPRIGVSAINSGLRGSRQLVTVVDGN